MTNLPGREPIVEHGPFGVFSVDRFGTVGELIGMWFRTLAEAERYLKLVKEQHSQNYVALNRAAHAQQIAEQRAAGIAFKTGHDLLMDEFDQWLKDNHCVRAVEAAALLDLSDKEFKSAIKRGLIKGISMPNHGNLIGFPAKARLTKEQHQQLINEETLNAHEVAEELGVTQKEFNEIIGQSMMTSSGEIAGHTRPRGSRSNQLYSRAELDQLRPAALETKEKRLTPPPTTRTGH